MLETDYREITGPFYSDFRSVMAGQPLRGFMPTFAAPRASRILAATGGIEHWMGERFVETILRAQAEMLCGPARPIRRTMSR